MRADGNTPLEEDETAGLIPTHLSTRAELNQWEAANVARAMAWLATRPLDVLDLGALQRLHRRMFDQTWAWAGTFRRTDTNISPYHWPEVPRLTRDLLEDTRAQLAALARDGDELDRLAARFHHALVRIHPWPNGNGRHGRLATDVLLERWGRPRFTWGAAGMVADVAAVRSRYIEALRRADAGDMGPLYTFVRT